MGFKHAYSSFGAFNTCVVYSDPALCRGQHFVTVGEVSFHKVCYLFIFYLEVEKGERVIGTGCNVLVD